jgi:molybdate transport system substrate-binding protein
MILPMMFESSLGTVRRPEYGATRKKILRAGRLQAAIVSALIHYVTLVSCCQLFYAFQADVSRSAEAGRQKELLVGAASDLTPAERPLSAAFKELTGSQVRFVFAASGVLARQIRAGAPYDALLSANIAYIKDLERDGFVTPDTVHVYAVGRLGTWSDRGLGWADLTAGGVRHIAIANPAHAPYGAAAREALERAGLWKRVEAKLVYGENVRQALQFAETGNADVVITAWSVVKDLKGATQVDAKLHAPIQQAAAAVAASRQSALARRFVDFLSSERGQTILSRYGFDRPAAR